MSKQLIKNILCVSILIAGDVSTSVYAATGPFSAFSSTEEKPLSFEEELPVRSSINTTVNTPRQVIVAPVKKVEDKPKQLVVNQNNIITPVAISQPRHIITQPKVIISAQQNSQQLTVETAKRQLLEAEQNAERIRLAKVQADKEYLANVNKARQLKDQLEAAEKLEKEQRIAAERLARIKEKEDAKAKKAAEWQAYLVSQQKKKDEERLAKEAERKAKEDQRAALKAEAARKVAAENEARLKAEAERKALAERDALLKAESIRKANAEREAKLKAEAERKALAEREAFLKAEAERKVAAENAAKLKAEREAALKAEAARKVAAENAAKLKAQAELKESEARLKAEADLQTKLKAEAAFKAAADREAVLIAEAKRKALIELNAKKDQLAQTNNPVVDQKIPQSTSPLAQKNIFPAQSKYPVAYSPVKPLGTTPLQRATSIFGASAAKGSPIRQQILGYSASLDQIKAFDDRYKYDSSKISVLPKQIASIQLNPQVKLNGDQLNMFKTLADKAAVEEYMAYHPLHAEALGNYIKRIMTLNDGYTNGLTIEGALMNELTFNLGGINVPTTSMSNAPDQYLYISSRLNENDQVKFWSWVNAVRIGDQIQVPSWVKLVDVMYSH